jgi:hypothetical protein
VPRRRQLNVGLSEEARRAWQRVAVAHHVTLTALLEALAAELDGLDEPPLDELPPYLRAAVERARVIDAERRRRDQ